MLIKRWIISAMLIVFLAFSSLSYAFEKEIVIEKNQWNVIYNGTGKVKIEGVKSNPYLSVHLNNVSMKINPAYMNKYPVAKVKQVRVGLVRNARRGEKSLHYSNWSDYYVVNKILYLFETLYLFGVDSISGINFVIPIKSLADLKDHWIVIEFEIEGEKGRPGYHPVFSQKDIFEEDLSATESEKPYWCVFKIKEFFKVEHSDDKKFSIIEGVTIKGRKFKVKAVWNLLENGYSTLDGWLSKEKTDFEPYIIAGMITSQDPLTIEPDTLTPKGGNFKAPEENIY